MTTKTANIENFLAGTADEMHADAREVASDLRDIIEYGTEQEKTDHLSAAKDFLFQCGISISTLDEAADEIEGFTMSGSPTMVLVGHEAEFGSDEWNQLGMAESAGGYADLFHSCMDFKRLGEALLGGEERTKATYGKTDLWVYHG